MAPPVSNFFSPNRAVTNLIYSIRGRERARLEDDGETDSDSPSPMCRVSQYMGCPKFKCEIQQYPEMANPHITHYLIEFGHSSQRCLVQILSVRKRLLADRATLCSIYRRRCKKMSNGRSVPFPPSLLIRGRLCFGHSRSLSLSLSLVAAWPILLIESSLRPSLAC